MRRKDKKITEPEIISEILKSSNICRVALIHNQKPYIVPVNYGFSDGILYFHSAPEGLKIEALEQNNYVCFEIETGVETLKGEKACDWTTKYRSVIGYGHIEKETDTEKKKQGLDIIMRAHGAENSEFQYSESSLRRMIILKLKIDEISGKQSGF